MTKTDACLNCTLPICDETSNECGFVQIEKRIVYFAAYYDQNRNKKLQAAKESYLRRRSPELLERKREYSRRRRAALAGK